MPAAALLHVVRADGHLGGSFVKSCCFANCCSLRRSSSGYPLNGRVGGSLKVHGVAASLSLVWGPSASSANRSFRPRLWLQSSRSARVLRGAAGTHLARPSGRSAAAVGGEERLPALEVGGRCTAETLGDRGTDLLEAGTLAQAVADVVVGVRGLSGWR